MSNLTYEQQRIIALREHYAQQGINYDKSTRYFLEKHADDDQRPTEKLIPVAIDKLRQLGQND